MVRRPRPLDPAEIEALLALDVPARLATLDRDGFPHVTPLWFLWIDGAFYMTSIADRPHLRRLAVNPRAGVLVDTEDAERDDGQRPNRQVRAIGEAQSISPRQRRAPRSLGHCHAARVLKSCCRDHLMAQRPAPLC